MLEIANWKRESRAFARIRFTPPQGDDVAEVVVEERTRPLVPLRALAERLTPGASIKDARHVTTVEGELGALLACDVSGVHHTLGVIYGDDFQLIIRGRTERPEERERIRNVTEELLFHFPLGLGKKRYRRFWYRPPAGWQGLVRGLVTDWYPLDYPRYPATIKVLPARPLDTLFELDTHFRDDSFAGLTIDDLTRTPLTLTRFRGSSACALSGEQAFVTAALEDRQYMYVLRLTTLRERLSLDEPVFFDVVKSCVPLPIPVVERPRSLAPSNYWIG
jgi:hypothetical protein